MVSGGMEFALRPLPASSLSVSRRPLGLGFQSASRIAVPCFRNNFARRVQPCLRCSPEEEAETSEQGRSKAETPHPPLSHADFGASVDTLASEEHVKLTKPVRRWDDERVGVLLLNLGGPESLEDVQPFLYNLFADPVTLYASSWNILVFFDT